MLKKYRFGFDASGLILFLIVMIPSIFWAIVPAPTDILRSESATAAADTIGSVCQALFIGSLCFIINKDRSRLRLSPLMMISVVCIVTYYAGWVAYYRGITDPIVILATSLPPCLAFLFFALDRKNLIAVVPIVGFTICHLIFALVNFIL